MLPALAALALGALLAACGLPYAWSFLSPLPLAALLAFTAASRTPRVGAARLFWAGLAFFTLTLYWLPVSFGAGFGAFGAIMFLPLYALEAGFWAALGWLCLRLVRRFEARVLLLAFAWVALEWARHQGQLGFPWGTLGYTLLPLPVVQVADLGGVLLLSLLVTFMAASLALAVRGHFRPLLAATALWGGAAAYGLTRTAGSGPSGQALLLRTNLNSFSKAVGEADLVAASRRLTNEATPAEVPVWSESSLSSYRPEDLRTQLLPRSMLVGVAFGSRPPANSAIAWDGEVKARYDKMQLVPFGEYSPLAARLRGPYEWIYARLGFPFNPPEPGTSPLPLTLQGRKYGTYICYDSVFGPVAAALVRNGAEVLVNVSNDGWYGNSVGVEQHFQMGRVRAIETRRFVLRSVNDGVAAVVDDLGHVQQRFGGPGEGTLHARFSFLTGLTPYVKYGNVPVLALLVFGAIWAFVVDRRRNRWDW